MKNSSINLKLSLAFLVSILFWLQSYEVAAGKERLFIIDDDVGMLRDEVRKAGTYQAPWLKIADPDGGLELIYALREPEIKVLGITCSMGCSTTDVCMASVRKILSLTGRDDVPVFRGADSPEDLGRPTEASQFIIETVMSNPGRVEIMATAPLTNIATALMLEPRLPENWKALHFATGEFMGALGESSDGAMLIRWSFYEDLNINADREATRYVLEHGGRFPVYPNENMDEAVLRMSDRKALKKAGTPLSTWVASETLPFTIVGSAGGLLGGYERGMALHGVIPLAVAIEPGLAQPPMELRFSMQHGKGAGSYFVISDDESIPTRPVFVKVRDPGAIEERLLERCR